MINPRKIGLNKPASIIAVRRRPIATPEWIGCVRSAIIIIDSGWAVPNPRPNIDIAMTNPTSEVIEGI